MSVELKILNVVLLSFTRCQVLLFLIFFIHRLCLKVAEGLAGLVTLLLMTFQFKMDSVQFNFNVHLRIPKFVAGLMFMVITLTGREPMDTQPVLELGQPMTTQQDPLAVSSSYGSHYCRFQNNGHSLDNVWSE